MDIRTFAKRPLREIQNVLEEQSKANKKAKPHALATCPSLGKRSNENNLEPCTPEPHTPLAQALHTIAYTSPKQIGFLEQLYNRLRRQQAKGKPLHVEDHVKTIQDALSKELKAKGQALQSWSDGGWYEEFLAIKNKTYPQQLSQLKEVFLAALEDSAFRELIHDGVTQRQAWWSESEAALRPPYRKDKDPAKACPSKENFVKEIHHTLSRVLSTQDGEGIDNPNPYVKALLEAEGKFLQRNMYENRENLYICSFGAVHWYALLSQQDKSPEDFMRVQEKLVEQIIQGLKTEGEQVIYSAEESLRQLDLLLGLLNPDKA